MSSKHIQFQLVGYLRLPQVLALYPVGKSSWWRGVKDGRYPKPVKLAPRTSAWKAEDIAALLESLGDGGGNPPCTFSATAPPIPWK